MKFNLEDNIMQTPPEENIQDTKREPIRYGSVPETSKIVQDLKLDRKEAVEKESKEGPTISHENAISKYFGLDVKNLKELKEWDDFTEQQILARLKYLEAMMITNPADSVSRKDYEVLVEIYNNHYRDSKKVENDERKGQFSIYKTQMNPRDKDAVQKAWEEIQNIESKLSTIDDYKKEVARIKSVKKDSVEKKLEPKVNPEEFLKAA